MKRDFSGSIGSDYGDRPRAVDCGRRFGIERRRRDIDFIIFRLTVITPTGVSGESLNVLHTKASGFLLDGYMSFVKLAKNC